VRTYVILGGGTIISGVRRYVALGKSKCVVHTLLKNLILHNSSKKLHNGQTAQRTKKHPTDKTKPPNGQNNAQRTKILSVGHTFFPLGGLLYIGCSFSEAFLAARDREQHCSLFPGALVVESIRRGAAARFKEKRKKVHYRVDSIQEISALAGAKDTSTSSPGARNGTCLA
jgi:hypothetical protein